MPLLIRNGQMSFDCQIFVDTQSGDELARTRCEFAVQKLRSIVARHGRFKPSPSSSSRMINVQCYSGAAWQEEVKHVLISD